MDHKTFILQKQLAEDAADRNFTAMTEQSPWLFDLVGLLDPIMAENASVRSRYRKLVKLADRVNAAVAPHAVCRRGCSACCHISVSLAATEAEIIGHEIGRAPAKIQGRFTPDGMTERYFGVPCPFLQDKECSIYEHRPLECRLHANIGHTPDFCSTDVPPEESVVPNVNLQAFHAAYAMLMTDRRGLADIREFFGGTS